MIYISLLGGRCLPLTVVVVGLGCVAALDHGYSLLREKSKRPRYPPRNSLLYRITSTRSRCYTTRHNSLQRMLEAFIKDTKPNLSQAEVRRFSLCSKTSTCKSFIDARGEAFSSRFIAFFVRHFETFWRDAPKS